MCFSKKSSPREGPWSSGISDYNFAGEIFLEKITEKSKKITFLGGEHFCSIEFAENRAGHPRVERGSGFIGIFVLQIFLLRKIEFLVFSGSAATGSEDHFVKDGSGRGVQNRSEGMNFDNFDISFQRFF